jgi:hypothetical protein
MRDAAFGSYARCIRSAESDYFVDRANIADIVQRQQLGISFFFNMFGAATTVKAPFADNDVVDFLLTVPFSYRIKKQAYKEMISRHFPKLAHFRETSSGLPIMTNKIGLSMHWHWNRVVYEQLPKYLGIWYRPHNRRAYAHYNEWIRTQSVRGYIEKALDAGKCYWGKWLITEEVKKLVDLHMSGKINAYGQISGILTLSHWFLQASKIPISISDNN